MKRFIIPLLVCVLIALLAIPPPVAHAQENPAAVRDYEYKNCTTSFDVYISAVDFGYRGKVIETLPPNCTYVSMQPIAGIDSLGMSQSLVHRTITFRFECLPGESVIRFSYKLKIPPQWEVPDFVDGVLIDEFGRQFPVKDDVIPFCCPWSYDYNYDCIMSKSEAIVAVADYFAGYITKAQALEVIAWYYESNPQ